MQAVWSKPPADCRAWRPSCGRPEWVCPKNGGQDTPQIDRPSNFRVLYWIVFSCFFPTAIKWDNHNDFTGTKHGEIWPSKHGDWVNQPIREIGESLHLKQTLCLNALDPFVFLGPFQGNIIGGMGLHGWDTIRYPVDSSWFYGGQTWFVCLHSTILGHWGWVSASSICRVFLFDVPKIQAVWLNRRLEDRFVTHYFLRIGFYLSIFLGVA